MRPKKYSTLDSKKALNQFACVKANISNPNNKSKIMSDFSTSYKIKINNKTIYQYLPNNLTSSFLYSLNIIDRKPYNITSEASQKGSRSIRHS